MRKDWFSILNCSQVGFYHFCTVYFLFQILFSFSDSSFFCVSLVRSHDLSLLHQNKISYNTLLTHFDEINSPFTLSTRIFLKCNASFMNLIFCIKLKGDETGVSKVTTSKVKRSRLFQRVREGELEMNQRKRYGDTLQQDH